MAKEKKYYKSNNKNFKDNEFDDSLKKFVIILLVVLGVIAIVWFFMELKNGTFSKSDTAEEQSNTTTIQYEEIMAGQTFNRKESEYYVIFADSDKDFYSVYQSYMSSSDKKIYIVDIGNSINDKYVSDETNSNAQSSSELKVKDNTLIKISNGQNILYLEGYEAVINELKN